MFALVPGGAQPLQGLASLPPSEKKLGAATSLAEGDGPEGEKIVTFAESVGWRWQQCGAHALKSSTMAEH